jgi:cystathionine beta-lyase
LLKGFGIEIEAYDPAIGARIADLIRPTTALIWTESPGSVTMEVQDVPAIVAVAKARGVPVALDNTYAAGVLFDAFHHGVDVSMQALTKYVGGHSDLLLGSVSVSTAELYEQVGSVWSQLGMAVSPDDASLALRGLQTLGIRLERLESSALKIATWLKDRPEIETVLHPALPDCPGHALWKRDFTGSASVFSFVFGPEVASAKVPAFVDGLELFRKGFSWGGTVSLAMIYPNLRRPNRDYEGRLVRLNIGLEEPDDLIADLARALKMLGPLERLTSTVEDD